MCTIMLHRETLPAELTPRRIARRQVDRLMARDRSLATKLRSVGEKSSRPFDWLFGPPEGIYVWLDNWCFGDNPKGFYYVRYRLTLKVPFTTMYDHPVLIVQKSKLRPDQVEFMERKCRETKRKWERGQKG